ncbi:response regulator [Candidatus Woesearchaeota archaeon]|nr:response regulator [Candidatus Woesearchaeota archaeon]
MKKILYVEDNEDTAEVVKMILTHEGFQTNIALTGKEGIEKAKEDFDLFLLDVMLPDMSGWDVFHKIKKKRCKGKCAFLSIVPKPKKTEELKKMGVEDYILKPFTKDDLIKRVRKLLGYS